MDNGPIDWSGLIIQIVALALFVVVTFWVALEIREKMRQAREQREQRAEEQRAERVQESIETLERWARANGKQVITINLPSRA